MACDCSVGNPPFGCNGNVAGRGGRDAVWTYVSEAGHPDHRCANYGHASNNRMFSSNKPGDPRELLEQTRAGVDAPASMNESYGLCQPVATLGSHLWLRDSLTNTSEKEAGNAEPFPSGKLPKRG